MAARVIPVSPFDLVIFGGTGDLARRKLLPALYHRYLAGQIPESARILGVARAEMEVEAYRAEAGAALRDHVAAAHFQTEPVERFLQHLDYLRVDALSETGWDELRRRLDEQPERIRVFYLAIGSSVFAPTAKRLKESGVLRERSRIVVEKPLGHDLASARALNDQLAEVADESRIYRIDHYLGKETVQNLMALRFANALLEPLWNARYVDHVQITVAETVGVEGRGSYYDESGAIRDMVQNHLLQLLCLTAMEPPPRFAPDAVRSEKLKVLQSLEPIENGNMATRLVRGQYLRRGEMRSYFEDIGVESSNTESFVAMKVAIANWRWSGTPFYLRTGKRLRARVSEIAVVFKEVPHSIFQTAAGTVSQNVLAIRLQPDEGITLRMTIKDPGPGGMRLTDAPLDMSFSESLDIKGLRMPDAYERLVMDVVRGDQTLFMRGDEVEAAWAWVDPILAAIEESGARPSPYDPGGSGPEDALLLIHRDGRRWRDIVA